MGIEVASSFTRKAAVPLDDSSVVADLTARDAIVSGVRYEGMVVFVVSEGTNYQLIGGITNSDWQEFSGSGGGGLGGAMVWRALPGNEASLTHEYGQEIYVFSTGGDQSIESGIRVPDSYKPGRQLFARIPHYSPVGTFDSIAFELHSYLVDTAIQALSDTSVENVDTQTAASSLQDVVQFPVLDVTDATGQIDGVAVQPGHIIKFRLTRVDASPESTADLKVLHNMIGVF